MSNLATTTERRAIAELAKCLRNFDNLSGLNMTSEDAWKAREAENNIKTIIESNGYNVRYIPGKGTIITKTH